MRFFRPLSVFVLLVAAASLPVRAQSAQSAPIPNRITAPIDDQNLVTLRGNVHPMAQARFDQGEAPSSMPTGRIMLLFERSTVQQQALTQYLSDVQNPGSPSYHKWLTPSQYGAAYGLSDSDLQTVESWLAAQGFKVEKVPQARNLIEFSGMTGQIQSAFHTAIHTFSVLGQTHYANVSDPQIPAALAPVVAAVTPLNDFRPKPHFVQGGSGNWDASTHTIQPNLTLYSGTTPILFVDPADAATIYDTPNTNLNANFTTGTTYDGTGINIGVVGVSDLTLPDVQNYRVAFLNETTSTVNMPTVVIDGDDPGLTGAGVESLLDAEVSGGIAPKAKIYYYGAADTDLTSGLYNTIIRAVDDNTVSILSMSYGECEAGLGSGGNNFIFEEAQQAAAQGITWVVSAGDGGSAGCDNFDSETQAQYGLQVSGMASTPWTIAVGGTDFDTLPANFTTYASAGGSNGTPPYYRTALKYIPENPWNDSTTVNTTIANNVRYTGNGGNIVAGSGGMSSCSDQSATACLGGYAKPAFQTSLTPADSVRDLPDVSLFAANGYEDAVWAICSDSVTDGSLQAYTDCQTSGGAFVSGTRIGGVGGTSASAPAFAGVLALVAQAQGGARLGQANTIIYQLAKSKYATVFHDVTVGDNSVPCVAGSPNCGTNGFETGYNAGTGYDLATGLGSVDVNQLIQNWGSVALTSTSTSFKINGSTAAYTGVHGKAVTFNAGVTPVAATGAVAVIDTANETAGGTANGPQNDGQVSIPLTSGAGSVSYNGLPGGTYTVSARYTGDTSDASSTSTPAISVTITPEASTTVLELNAYNGLTGSGIGLTSVPYGSYVFADALIEGTAEGANSDGVATGTVTFTDGGTTLGTASVGANGNLASWPPLNANYAVLSPGSHTITAKYSGDPSFNASTSSSVAVTVVKPATVTSATPSAATVNYNSNTPTVSVTITTPYNLGTYPTGTVTMTANGTTVGTISSLTPTITGTTLPNIDWELLGTGSLNGTLLAPGSNTITVTYSGDANYASSTTTLSISSTIGLGSFTLANTGNMTLVAGQMGTNTLTATPAGGFYSSVNFTCAGSGPVSCAIPAPIILNGSATTTLLSVSAASGGTPGSYPVTVTGTDFTGKITAQTTFNVTVTALSSNAGFTMTNNGPLTLNAGATGQPVTVTATPTNGYVGTVDLSCAVTTNLSSPTSLPTCSLGLPITINSTSAATSTVNIGTTSTTTTGAYTVMVTGTDSSNATITASTPIALTVNAAPVPTITLASSGNITVSPGAATGNTSTISVTPGGGFTGTVNLTCALTTSPSGATDLPTCSTPGSVSITGTTAATATLTVNTTAATSALDLPLKKYFLGGGGAVLALVLFFGIPARRRAWRSLFMVLALVVVAGAVGCGGGSNSGGGGGGGKSGTTAGSYTVTVTGTDAATGKVTSNVAVTVTVN